MHAISDIMTRLGLSRDDWKWFWSQLVCGATFITTAGVDWTSFGAYVGIQIPLVWAHRIMILCVAIGWVSARLSTSPLYNKTETAAIVRADQHV